MKIGVDFTDFMILIFFYILDKSLNILYKQEAKSDFNTIDDFKLFLPYEYLLKNMETIKGLNNA